VAIDPERVYFTWPDRVFSYECRGCGACCKGLGIGLDAVGGQTEALTAAYPQLIPFLRRRGDAVTAFNPRDRCWFLADDGLCRVETDLGRAAKPASCRLFPFNRVFRIGGFVIVDYNSVICPLRADRAPTAACHAEVLAEMEGIADPAIVSTNLPAQMPEIEGRELVERERPIAEACFAAAASGDLDAAWTAQGGGPSIDEAFAAIAGTPWREPEGATLEAALWLTPSMRFNELFGPRQYSPRAQMVQVLPRWWLAWLGFAAIGAELARRPLGLQELTTIWTETASLCFLVARWADPPVVKPGTVELPATSADPGGIVRQFAQDCVDNRRLKKPLSALLGPRIADLSRVERVTLLKLAEPVLRAAYVRAL
jgi:Fe-S-cluster containining protein